MTINTDRGQRPCRHASGLTYHASIMTKHLLPLLLFGLAATAEAQKLTPNTQLYLDETATRTNRVAASSDSLLRAFVQLQESADAEAIASVGVRINSQAGSLLTVSLTAAQIQQLAALDEVKSIQIASEVRPLMDDSRRLSNADEAHNAENPLGQAYMGSGVIVGIIDSGFEYDHLDFYSPTGRFRIARVWNQNATGSLGETPSGFDYGKEYTTEEVIKQARYDVTSTYHGSHVTGIAAGGDMTQPYYGVAPEADLVLVSFRDDNVCIADGVKYITDYAQSVGKPCVINISLGTHLGPHDGTSVTDRYFDELAGPGRIIVGACGNEGETKLHARKVFSASDNTLTTAIKFASSQSRASRIDIWGSKGGRLKVKGVVLDALKGSIVAETPEVDTDNPTESAEHLSFSSEQCGAEGYIALTAVVDETNGRPNVLLETRITSLSSYRQIGLVVTGEDGTEVNLWSTTGDEFLGTKRGWTAGDSEYTVGEIGGTGRSVISVGSYHTKSTYTSLSGNVYPDASQIYDLQPGQLSPFSSVGPTLDGRMKPEVTAPGWIVVSAMSKFYEYFYASESVAVTERNGSKYYYDANGGTSMSSPYVAGSIALWLEACPTLTADDIRALLEATSINDEYTAATPNAFGYGRIDTYAGLAAACQKESGIARVPGTDLAARVSQEGDELRITFRQDQGATTARLYNTQGICMMSREIATTSPGQTTSLHTGALTPGLYFLRLDGEVSRPLAVKVLLR